MAAPAVAVVVKKVAAVVVSDKKLRNFVIGIILGIIVILLMPLGAIAAFFSMDVDVETERLQEIIIENLSAEEQEMLQGVEDTMYAIEDKMIEADFASRVKEAQVLYIMALSEESSANDFVDRLVACFSDGQTDAELIEKVNETFGKEIVVEDFSNVMQNIRSSAIDTSDYFDLNSKNNLDLAKWAEHAADKQWGYVYGTFGTVLDESMLTMKMDQYPEDVTVYEEFIRSNWMGRRCADCVGLIKGYGWYNTVSKEVEYGTNGMPDYSANGMYDYATEKGAISSIPEIPGLAVWKDGHIGIYIGNGKVVEAMTTTVGVVETNLSDGSWTHWLKVPSITYYEEA